MDKTVLSALDAFVALRDVDDDDIVGMVKENSLTEGKQFGIFTSDLEEAKEELSRKDEDLELEVIDADADSIDHLKNKEAYVGQLLLQCNKCMATRFLDANKLVASEDDPDVYNVDDECPHCHSVGVGYELKGQVGAVPAEEKNIEDEIENDVEPEIDNDEATDDVKFDNDDVAEEEVVEEEPKAEEAEEAEYDGFDFDEEEKDGMETTSHEDEDADVEVAKAGDEIEEKIPEEDIEENKVEEAANTDYEFKSENAKKAWMMNKVITAMNNQDAYYRSGWLDVWPDDETKRQCEFDFADKENFDELEDTFNSVYKYYHEDGLFKADDETVDFAHKVDELLGLHKIDNLIPQPKEKNLDEAFHHESVSQLFDAFIDPEYIDSIVVYNVASGDAEVVYQGNYEDMPDDIKNASLVNFDAGDGYFTVNVDTAETEGVNLEDALEVFDDDFTNKIIIWDQEQGEDIMQGSKEEVIKEYGEVQFLSFESPERLEITINDKDVVAEAVEAAKEESLFEAICKANNLASYRANKMSSNEYWINEALDLHEDLDLIYKTFILPVGDAKLVERFKKETGYKDIVDEAKEQLGIVEECEHCCKEEQPEEKAEEEIKAEAEAPVDECVNECAKKEVVEEVRSFKSRRDLGVAVEECKNNNRPYSIRRSVKEGFRYDLITEAEVEPVVETVTAAEPEANDFEDEEGITYDEYVQNAKDFAAAVADMSKEEVENYFYNDFEFDKKLPVDEAEEIVYKALLAAMDKKDVEEALESDPNKVADKIEKIIAEEYPNGIENDEFEIAVQVVSDELKEAGFAVDENKLRDALTAHLLESLDEAKKDEPELPADPDAVKVEAQRDINDLLADEIEAVDGYNEVIQNVQESSVEHRDEIVKELEHIRDEELEHMDELNALANSIPFEKDNDKEEEKEVEEVKVEEPVIEEPIEEPTLEEPEQLEALEESVADDVKLQVDDHEIEDEEGHVLLSAEKDADHVVYIDAYAKFDPADFEYDFDPDSDPTYVPYGDRSVVYDNGKGGFNSVDIGKLDWEINYQDGDEKDITKNDAKEILDLNDTKMDELEKDICKKADEDAQKEINNKFRKDPTLIPGYDDFDESVDFDEVSFDKEMNEYFKEAYNESVEYKTVSGTVDKNGVIVLEGLVSLNGKEQNLTFTLTPTLNESVGESVLYKVTNNLSEEVFEYQK